MHFPTDCMGILAFACRRVVYLTAVLHAIYSSFPQYFFEFLAQHVIPKSQDNSERLCDLAFDVEPISLFLLNRYPLNII